MRVGIYLDLRNPAPWRRPWPDVYAAALDLVAEAEHLGADTVWLSEHHGFDDGYLPQPLVLAAALAARTTRIRIGTAVLLAPLRQPRHVAEEAALVDVISGGRLELALGAGYSVPEFDAFGVDPKQRYPLTEAMAVELVQLWRGGTITPPPVQAPPPVWLGYQGPRGARRAGELGVGLLSLDRALLPAYLDGLVAGGHRPDAARMGGVVHVLVAEDPDRARERVLPHYAHQANTYRQAAVAGTGRPPPKELTVDRLRAGIESRGGIPGLNVLTASDAIAHVDDRVADLPATDVYVWASIAAMPDDLVAEHLRLWLGTVASALRDRSPGSG